MTCLHNIRYKKLYDNKVFPLGSTEKLLSSTQNDTFSNPRRYAFLLKDARNYWKMFEGEGDKKKKVYPACPMYGARRIHLIIYMRDICPIAYFTIFMVLFPHFRINKPLPGILFFWNSEVFILHTSWPSALYT